MPLKQSCQHTPSLASTAAISSFQRRMISWGPSSIISTWTVSWWSYHPGCILWNRSSHRFSQGTDSYRWIWNMLTFTSRLSLISDCSWDLCFEGVSYQNTFLPFGLSLAPCTFKKYMDTALFSLRQKGVCVRSYLYDSAQLEVSAFQSLVAPWAQDQFSKSSLSPSQLHLWGQYLTWPRCGLVSCWNPPEHSAARGII